MEWCEERYSLRFDESDRRDFPPDDPAYKAAHILSAWLDVEESGYRDGVPLALVMDELGYRGDRSGLVDSSVVTDVEYNRRGITFVVRDNFSDLDICGALADRLGVGIGVSVSYRFSEGGGLERGGGPVEETVRPKASLREEISERISETVERFGREGATVPFGGYAVLSRMIVESVGPEPDRINLVRDGVDPEGGPARRTVRVSEIGDRMSLEYVLRIVKENYAYREAVSRRADVSARLTSEDALEIAARAKLADGGETDLSGEVRMELEAGATPAEALREWDVEIPDGYLERKDLRYVEGRRAGMLEDLYGSSAAYQNVSEFMLGFDLDYRYPVRIPLEWEDVERIVRSHSPSVPDAQVENAAGMFRSGVWSAEKAVESFAVAVTEEMYRHEPARLVFRYDGDEMLSFVKDADRGPDVWRLDGDDPSLIDLFRDRTGIDLERSLCLEMGGPVEGFASGRLLDVAGAALLSPANRAAAKDAAVRCTRRMRRQEAWERFNRPLAPKGPNKGVRR